jgi:glycosyltransferase involved in cell wall biosynthesis
MKVNIVTEGKWIKRFWSEKLVEYNQTDIEYSIGPQRNDVDSNFYVCYNTYLPYQKSQVLDVGYVTHIHKNNPDEHAKDIGFPFKKFKELDVYIHQCSRTIEQFKIYGIKGPHYRLPFGVETDKFVPRIFIGVIQNGEVEGKGLYFFKELVQYLEEYRNYICFIFCGNGWNIVTNEMDKYKIPYRSYRPNEIEYKNVLHSSMYKQIDYLFVPSLWEGGPVAVQEALSCHIPIISANVGFVKDYSIKRIFEPGDIDGALDQFETIVRPVINRKKPLHYKAMSIKLAEIFYENIIH